MVLRVVIAGLMYSLTIGIVAIISFFMVVFRQDKRSLHDWMAATYVKCVEPIKVESSILIQSFFQKSNVIYSINLLFLLFYISKRRSLYEEINTLSRVSKTYYN
jgi:hypothetical protein